jgi:hypothetical protein
MTQPDEIFKIDIESEITGEYYPVMDALADTQTTLKAIDAINAVCGDPSKCVVANGFARKRATLEVRIGYQVAYIRHRSTPNQWHRYTVDNATAARIKAFDKDPVATKAAAAWIDGQVVVLHVPSPTVQLGYKAGKSGTNVRGGGNRNVVRSKSLRHVTPTPPIP